MNPTSEGGLYGDSRLIGRICDFPGIMIFCGAFSNCIPRDKD
jgi:hypothetical protein